MDAPGGKIDWKILRQRPPPLQQIGRCIIQRIECSRIFLLPAQIAQGTSTANFLRCTVEDHRRIFIGILLHAAPHAVIQFPQCTCRFHQPLPQFLSRRQFRPRFPFDPFSAKGLTRQQQEQACPPNSFRQKRKRNRVTGRQQHRHHCQQNRPCRHTSAAALSAARKEPGQTHSGRKNSIPGPKAEITDKPQPQPHRNAPKGIPAIGAAKQQKTQQTATQRKTGNLQIHHSQC